MCKTSNSRFKVGLADGANPLSICIVPPLAQGFVLRATVSLEGSAGAPGRSGAIRFGWALHAYKSASTFIDIRSGLFVCTEGIFAYKVVNLFIEENVASHHTE